MNTEWGNTDPTWRIRKHVGDVGTTFYAVAPGCPHSPHPIRNCDCQAFRSLRDAERHITHQSA